MMEQRQTVLDNPYVEAIKGQIPFQQLVHAGLDHAAVGLSGLLARTVTLASMQIQLVALEQATVYLGDPETLVVGVLLIGQDASSHYLLVLPIETAYRLVDVAMEQPVGTTQDLDELGLSVMGELGNMVVAYFLNQITEMTHTTALPSPPAVAVDMLGAILDAVLLPAALLHDQILLLNAQFHCAQEPIELSLVLVPDLPEEVMATMERWIDD